MIAKGTNPDPQACRSGRTKPDQAGFRLGPVSDLPDERWYSRAGWFPSFPTSYGICDDATISLDTVSRFSDDFVMKKQAYTVVASSGQTEIRQYAGSLGYQVWRNGVFYTFMPTLPDALRWLR